MCSVISVSIKNGVLCLPILFGGISLQHFFVAAHLL